MKWFLDVAYIAIGASYKWLLGLMVIVGVVIGALFAAGVLGGDGEQDTLGSGLTSATVPVPSPTATPPPTVSPQPSAVPTALPTPTLVPLPPPTTTPTVTPAPPSATPREITVPIFLQGATNVGSLEFVLVYEPSVLQFTKVEGGSLGSNALLESSNGTPGQVWAGMIDANGMTGDGHAALVTFRVIGNGESSTALTLESVVAYDANTLLDMITQMSPGSFTVKDLSLIPPSVGFLP